MKIWVHADDFGLSAGLSERITEVFHKSPLNSVSVVVNGHGLERAKELMPSMAGCRWSVHLNLVEGRPVSGLRSGSKLLGRDGAFNNNLISLAGKYAASSAAERINLKREIRGEIAAQMSKARAEFGWTGPLHVDSHQHLHILPFVFDALMGAAAEHNVAYVRLPRGAFSWDCSSWKNATAPFAPNMAKLVVYGALSEIHRPSLQARGITSCDRVVSILHTGKMNATAIRSELRSAKNVRVGVVEVLFHPAQPRAEEKRFWSESRLLRDYYFSPQRLAERDVLENEMRGVLAEFADGNRTNEEDRRCHED